MREAYSSQRVLKRAPYRGTEVRITVDDRTIWWIAVIAVAIVMRKPLVAALMPFLAAVALAAVLEPFVRRLEARAKMPRMLASFLVLIAFVIGGGYVLLLMLTKILSELVQMGSLLQRYQQVPVEFVRQLLVRWNELNELIDQRGLPGEVRDNILAAVNDLTQAAFNFVAQGINVVIGAVGLIPALLVILFIALISTYFLVKDKDALAAAILSIAPESLRARAHEMGRRVIVDLVGFFRAQLVLFLVTTVIVAIGLAWMGVNYWLTLALIAGVLDVIPVVGPGFLFLPWAISAWTLKQPVLAIQLLVLYAVIFLVRQILQPKILGDSIGVHPLAMLVAIWAGIQFFGVQGLIVGPVIVIIAKGVLSLIRED